MPNIDGYIMRRLIAESMQANEVVRKKLKELVDDNIGRHLSHLQLLHLSQAGNKLQESYEKLAKMQKIVTDELPALDEETRRKIEQALNGTA